MRQFILSNGTIERHKSQLTAFVSWALPGAEIMTDVKNENRNRALIVEDEFLIAPISKPQ